MNKKNIKLYLASAVGAAAVAAGVVVLDQVAGWNFFNLLESNQSQAQTAPSSRGASPAAQQPAAPAAPPVAPERVETIKYDAWTVTCRDTVEKSSKRTCTGIMQVIEQKSRRVLLAWVIGRDNQGVLRTVMQTPTGVQIPKGVELKLGKAPMRTLPFTACEPQRCDASVAMDDAMVKEAMASQEAVATIVATDGRGINFNMPIKGIDKVFAAIGKS